MPVGARIAVAVFAIVCAAIVVLGDGVWRSFGLPPGFGRVIFLCGLTLIIAIFIGAAMLSDHIRRRRNERKNTTSRS